MHKVRVLSNDWRAALALALRRAGLLSLCDDPSGLLAAVHETESASELPELVGGSRSEFCTTAAALLVS